MKNSDPQANQLASRLLRRGVESVPDFAISHHGTISLFHPLTEQADDWLRLHCPHDNEHQYFGQALAIEHRFVSCIISQAELDGMTQLSPVNEGRMN